MIYKRVFYLALLLISSYALYAQTTVSLSGTVIDEYGEAVFGATVLQKGTSNGTVTDMEGKFQLNAPEGSTLQISFLGYVTQDVEVSKTVLTITLLQDVETLQEAVVVGYGVQKKETLVGAVSQAKGQDIVEMGVPSSISQSMQGMLPGVTGIVSSGQPGEENAKLTIRGISSWEGDGSPLVLVDGVERDMNDVDPNEIASISVLKDASATAVFGVKGGNGVILITTKRGSAEETTINFSSNFGFKTPTNSTDYADRVTTMEWYNKALANDNMWKSQFTESTIEAWKNAYRQGNVGPYNDYYPEIDWWDEMVKEVGYSQNYNLNVRGGNEYVKHFSSIGYLHDGDIVDMQAQDNYDPRFYYDRYNWRSNFDFEISKTTKIGLDLSGSYSIKNQPNVGGGIGQFFNNIYNASPSDFPIRWDDGNYGTSELGLGNIALLAYQGQSQIKTFKGFIDMNIKQKLDFITKGLNFTGRLSYNASSTSRTDINMFANSGTVMSKFGEGNTYTTFFREYDYSSPTADGNYPLISETRYPTDEEFLGSVPGIAKDVWKSYGNRLYYEFRLDYKRQFKQHDVGAMFSFNRNENITNVDKYDSDYTTIEIPNRREDWVGRVTYNYDGRYILEANGAYNGSENFAKGKRYGFFPSASVGWRLSEEKFMRNLTRDFFSNLKVRYSIGQSGVDGTERFTYIQQYLAGGNIILGEESINRYGPMYREDDPANENATWETATKQNLGIEFDILSKFGGTVDLFNEKRTGILMERWLPQWINPNTAQANLGETKSHGFELQVNYKNKVGQHFNYRADANMMIVENRIVFKDDGTNTLDYERAAGKPIGYQRRYVADSYYESLDDIFNGPVTTNEAIQSQLIPGDILYVDYNADGTITNDAKDKAVMKGQNKPFKTYSFGGRMSYKNWAFNFRFYGIWDVYANIPGTILYDFQNASRMLYSANSDVIDSWTPDNAGSAVKPVLHANGNVINYSRKDSNWSYQNRSYLRLKNVELSYTFKQLRLTPDYAMPKLSIYTNGNNLYTWTDFNKRLDPESGGTGSYPMIRRFNIGLRATF